MVTPSDGSKRKRENEDEDCNVVPSSKRTNSRPTSVFVVMTCRVRKNGSNEYEDDAAAGARKRSTQNTEILGVYANKKDANLCAKDQVQLFQGENHVDEVIDGEDDGGPGLFHWQEDSSLTESAARKVWVEQQTIQY